MSCSLIDAVKASLTSVTDEKKIWVALSGGLDSTVLLHLTATIPEFKSRLQAIHIHHGLSQNADSWSGFCQTLCNELDVPLICEKVSVDDSGQGLEQAAREARYLAYSRSLGEGDILLMAHHADDQIETFFMRLMRGAGLNGLAAIRRQRQHQHFQLLRPLLHCTRQQLQQYADRHQLNWVEDESNQDTRFDRNWWRLKLLPQLWQRYPQRQASLLRSIEQLQQDREILQLLIQPELDACLVTCSWPLTYQTCLNVEHLMRRPEKIRPYIVRRWLETAGVTLPSATQLKSIFVSMLHAIGDKNPSLALNGWVLQRFKGNLYLHRANARSDADCYAHRLSLSSTDETDSEIRWLGNDLSAIQINEGLAEGCYRLIAAKTLCGQTIRPKGRPAKTLKHIWQENEVPVWLRQHWPCLITDKGELASVIGLAIDQAYLKQPGYSLFWGIRG